MKHLVVDISSHGLGHLAQTALVLNALDAEHVKLTLRTKIPEKILKERIKHPFTLIVYQQDTGMIMHDALQIDRDATMDWYQTFHASYSARKEQAAKELARLQPDAVFADVPYLSLDACSIIDVPSVALCSLNWADIFKTYCGELPGAEKIHREILNAYSKAQYFLQATPSMPMQDLANRRPIGPIASCGNKQRDILLSSTQQGEEMRFVLVGLGGIDMSYPLDTWPRINNVCWIFHDNALYLSRADFIPQSQIALPYTDLLASCDVILTKTGYGTQTEAVINQIPTLCVARGDWPEEPHLFAWHEQHGIVRFITWKDIKNNNFQHHIKALLEEKWESAKVAASGAEDAAKIIHKLL